ncbi:MAG: hypothetical protein L3J39_17830 [Verrucomicrobiales bacterium]|nr:hypothetical protein [Verrucomicrobiales bacterium]
MKPMKILVSAFSFLVIGTTCAQENETSAKSHDRETTKFHETPPPPGRRLGLSIGLYRGYDSLYRSYDSLDQLEKWAAETMFGGWVKTIQLSDRKIYYSVRTFTSGLPTYEVIFFSLDHRSKISPFLAIPLKGRELRVKAEKSRIVVEAFIDSTLTPILSFTSDMLPRLPIKTRAQQNAAEQPATAPQSKSK